MGNTAGVSFTARFMYACFRSSRSTFVEMACNKRQIPARESSFNAYDRLRRRVAGVISTRDAAVAMAKPLRWFTLDDEIVDEIGLRQAAGCRLCECA